ncbi:hypothetical protein L1049_000777 [Liquidambar formosana]|uniref:MATH domain-containing protein n=1 Tax=Liquidambar formosana TaxID=63359 RepID=A0AAP0R5P0_LIQFO
MKFLDGVPASCAFVIPEAGAADTANFPFQRCFGSGKFERDASLSVVPATELYVPMHELPCITLHGHFLIFPATSGDFRPPAGQEPSTSDHHSYHNATYKWTIPNFREAIAKSLDSPYFQAGGFDFRLVLYPKGNSRSLPGHTSLYLQITDPPKPELGCYVGYRLTISNHIDGSLSIHRDSYFRYSVKITSHGYPEFVSTAAVLDPTRGFLLNDSLVIVANVRVLDEDVTFSHHKSALSSNLDVLSGRFTWTVRNFSLFQGIIRTQNLISPHFQVGECNLVISVCQSTVDGVEYFSMFLESNDSKTLNSNDTSCWCSFKLSVWNRLPDLYHMNRETYGRFGSDGNTWDTRTIGWKDYMRMEDFVAPDGGFLVNDTVVFSVVFYRIKESNDLARIARGKSDRKARKYDGLPWEFTWKIENFVRLKDFLKKGKMTGHCIKSKRFQIGNQDFRLLVYPRGHSQAPLYLSMYLEVSDSRNTSCDWSCFAVYKLTVVNQRMKEKSVKKESVNRYSKALRYGGWREFMTLSSLFDQNSGFLIQDTVVFSAEVFILKETFLMQDFRESSNRTFHVNSNGSFMWKVENFFFFKEIMETRRLFSQLFQVGGCELRIGCCESSDTICAYLECDPSATTDPDKNFWVSYRIAVVNQKDPAKSLWKESSLCTNNFNISVLQFMNISDMLKADAGFLVEAMAVFVCEILDYCPWFDFSELEVLASDEDALSTDPDELRDSENSDLSSGNRVDIFKNLLVRAGKLTYGDNTPLQPLVTLKEKLQMDLGAIAGIVIRLRLYLDDPVKIKCLILQNKFSGSDDGKYEATSADESSSSLMNSMMGVKILQRTIDDLLLEILVECCQPSKGRFSEGSYDASPKPSPDTNGVVYQSESHWENGAADIFQSLINKRLGSAVEESTRAWAAQCPGTNRTAISKKGSLGQRALKIKWPEPSEELLGMIVNSLKPLNGPVPQGCQEPMQKPRSAEKIYLLLDKAPVHMQPDLVTLVSKLVDHSEHPVAACALLDRLQKPDAEPALRSPVLATISQLEFGSEVWECLLHQASDLLPDSNNGPLAATIGFIFTAATQCQQIPPAVRVVHARLRSLGAEVSQSVLNFLCKTVNHWDEMAEAMLLEIDSTFELDDKCLTNTAGPFLYNEDGPAIKRSHLVDEQLLCADCHFSDIYILIEMLAIPSCAVKAFQTFERGVAQGFIVDHSVAMVLERHHAKKSDDESISYTEKCQHKDIDGEGNIESSLPVQEVEPTVLLGLAETLSLSTNPQVHAFVRMLYATLFRLFADEGCRRGMLKRLVDHVVSPAGNCSDIGLDLLVFLVNEEQGIVRPLLSMMVEVAVVAKVDCAELKHQSCASEKENTLIWEDRQAELSDLVREKAVSEAANHFESEMKLEMECSAQEKKELYEQIQEIESPLKCFRSEWKGEIAKLSMEKRGYQDHLRDVETQLSQLQSQKRHELKKVFEEKNTLSEKLREAEAERQRLDEKVECYAAEAVTREEDRQSLLNEVRQLKKKVEEMEGEKQAKEQLTGYESYIKEMEVNLNACQQHILYLELRYRSEMEMLAPLYGIGLDDLSKQELKIVEGTLRQGLRDVEAALQRHCGGNPP